jgi:hypothetical protein
VHLRITVGSEVIVPVLPRFLEQHHPDVTLDVTLTDERADLAAFGVDVAVWLGIYLGCPPELSPGRRVICASPAYLAQRGRPKAPENLSEHNCIVYRARNYDRWWRLTRDGETIAVLTSGNLQTDSSSVLLTSARKGLGLVLVQESTVRRAITKGELVRVLADYEVSSTDFDIALYAVYPNSRHVSPKTRAFVDFLVTLFRQGTLHTHAFRPPQRGNRLRSRSHSELCFAPPTPGIYFHSAPVPCQPKRSLSFAKSLARRALLCVDIGRPLLSGSSIAALDGYRSDRHVRSAASVISAGQTLQRPFFGAVARDATSPAQVQPLFLRATFDICASS